MCIGIIWNNSFLVGGRARAEARIDPRPLLTSRSTAHGAQVVWPLDYMGSADKVSNHALLCHLKWPVFLHCLAKWGTWKSHFHSNAVLVHCQNSTCCCLISSVFLTHDSYLRLSLLYDFLNLVINAFSSGLLGAWLRKKEVESILQQLDCVARTMHQCAVFLKEKMSSAMCLIASNICWDNKISH